MAKRVRISDDESTWTTLPGNSAEFRQEGGQLPDSIFGQAWESAETGLISGTINTNALYKGFAGYIVNLKKAGTPTTLTTEAMSNVSGKIYQITDTAKQILELDANATITVYDNAVDHTDDVIRIDYLQGIIEFASAYTVTGSVTISGKYIPVTAIAAAKTFNLSLTKAAVDNTDIPSAKANGGYRTFDPTKGLKTVSLELGGFYSASNAFRDALAARTPLIVEINPDNNSKSVMRGLFKYTGVGQSGDLGALEEETVNMMLSVPDNDLYDAPWVWIENTGSTLNTGIIQLLTAFADDSLIYVQYLHDGTNGWQSDAVVTDMSLTGGLESMNEFSVGLQLSDAPTDVP